MYCADNEQSTAEVGSHDLALIRYLFDTRSNARTSSYASILVSTSVAYYEARGVQLVVMHYNGTEVQLIGREMMVRDAFFGIIKTTCSDSYRHSQLMMRSSHALNHIDKST